jgi:hypothetical protein
MQSLFHWDQTNKIVGLQDLTPRFPPTGLKIIIDDSKACKVAENIGLKLTGTIGVLMKAERLGLIPQLSQKFL